MQRATAIIFGLLVAVLGIAGLTIEGDRLLNLMNVDLPLDVLRLLLAVALLGAAFVAHRAIKAMLIITGVLYLGMAALALFDPTIFGLLPTGFSGFDIAFHIVTGAAALIIGLMRDKRDHSARRATPGHGASTTS